MRDYVQSFRAVPCVSIVEFIAPYCVQLYTYFKHNVLCDYNQIHSTVSNMKLAVFLALFRVRALLDGAVEYTDCISAEE